MLWFQFSKGRATRWTTGATNCRTYWASCDVNWNASGEECELLYIRWKEIWLYALKTNNGCCPYLEKVARRILNIADLEKACTKLIWNGHQLAMQEKEYQQPWSEQWWVCVKENDTSKRWFRVIRSCEVTEVITEMVMSKMLHTDSFIIDALKNWGS